jgi:capsular exopolysaccharide synthesis family protein
VDNWRYARVLSARKVTVLVTTLLTLCVVLVGTIRSPHVYTATTLVRVGQGATVSANYDPSYAARLADTTVRLLTSAPFLSTTIDQLKLPISPAELAGQIKVSTLADTELIEISVDNTDPQLAAAIANTLAEGFVKQAPTAVMGQGESTPQILQAQLTAMQKQMVDDRAELAFLSATPANAATAGVTAYRDNLAAKVQADEQAYDALLNQLQTAQVEEATRSASVTVAETAAVPARPSKPRLSLNLGMGLVAGLLGGVALAFTFERLDPRIYSPEELQAAAGVSVVGQIPRFKGSSSLRARPVLLDERGRHTPTAEAFRRTASNIAFLASRSGSRALLITSAEPGAGKSLIVANLAVAAAQAGHKVIAVDGDLRNPSLTRFFHVAAGSGLRNVLRDPRRTLGSLQETEIAGLKILPSGAAPADSGELLTEGAVQAVVDELKGQADLVLWDSPPVLAVADASAFGPLADGVLLVASRDHASSRDIQRALQELNHAGARMMGLIYNRAQEGNLARYYYVYAHQREESAGRIAGSGPAQDEAAEQLAARKASAS